MILFLINAATAAVRVSVSTDQEVHRLFESSADTQREALMAVSEEELRPLIRKILSLYDVKDFEGQISFWDRAQEVLKERDIIAHLSILSPEELASLFRVDAGLTHILTGYIAAIPSSAARAQAVSDALFFKRDQAFSMVHRLSNAQSPYACMHQLWLAGRYPEIEYANTFALVFRGLTEEQLRVAVPFFNSLLALMVPDINLYDFMQGFNLRDLIRITRFMETYPAILSIAKASYEKHGPISQQDGVLLSELSQRLYPVVEEHIANMVNRIQQGQSISGAYLHRGTASLAHGGETVQAP